MADKKVRSVNLNGWDVAYAIDFDDANKLIAQQKSSPKDFDYKDATKSIKGDFGDWQLNPRGDGHLVWMNIPMKNCSYICDGDQYDLGDFIVSIETSLEWVEGSENTGKHTLKITEDDSKVSVKELTPADVTSKIDDPDARVLLKSAIRDMLQAHVGFFKHIFASIDYTQQLPDSTEGRMEWLKITDHEYTVTPAADNAKGYLVVLGMTEHRKRPETHVAASTLVPEACNSGFAFNENLILENMIRPGLSKLLPDCDPYKDFDYDDKDIRTVLRSGPKELKFPKYTVDFKKWFSKEEVQPVLPYDPDQGVYGSLSIGVMNGNVIYDLKNLEYTLKTNPLFSPYDNLVITSAYLKGRVLLVEDQDTRGKWLICFKRNDDVKDKDAVNTKISPLVKDDNWGSWFVKEGIQFGVSLGIMLATCGTMKWMEGAENEAVGIEEDAENVRKGDFEPEAERRVSEEEIEEETKSQIGEGDFEPAEEEDMIPETDVAADAGKPAANRGLSKLLKSQWGSMAVFMLVQTFYEKGWEAIDFMKNKDLRDKAELPDFKKFTDLAFVNFTWPNVKDYTIKNGELVAGSFSIGLNLDFHEQ